MESQGIDLRTAIFFGSVNLCQKICDAQSTMEADDRPRGGSVEGGIMDGISQHQRFT